MAMMVTWGAEDTERISNDLHELKIHQVWINEAWLVSRWDLIEYSITVHNMAH